MKKWAPAVAALLSACTTQAVFTPANNEVIQLSTTGPVDTYLDDELPDVNYVTIGTISVHLEATHFIRFSFDDALERLEEKAGEVGANGLINIEEKRSRYLETSIYHVTADAIRYVLPD